MLFEAFLARWSGSKEPLWASLTKEKTMPKKVRVAMMSMAHAHADGYARQVGQIPDAELTCIWDDMP